jgi:hypothetical protein
MFDFDLELEAEIFGDVNECSVCSQLSIPRECKACGMDTCSMCKDCEYCA